MGFDTQFQIHMLFFSLTLTLAGLLIGLSLATIIGHTRTIMGRRDAKPIPKSKTPRGDTVVFSALVSAMPSAWSVLGITFAVIGIGAELTIFPVVVHELEQGRNSFAFMQGYWMTLIPFIVMVWPARNMKKASESCNMPG